MNKAQARALGLSSALKGPEFYEQYAASVRVTTPSERLLSVRDEYWKALCYSFGQSLARIEGKPE